MNGILLLAILIYWEYSDRQSIEAAKEASNIQLIATKKGLREICRLSNGST